MAKDWSKVGLPLKWKENAGEDPQWIKAQEWWNGMSKKCKPIGFSQLQTNHQGFPATQVEEQIEFVEFRGTLPLNGVVGSLFLVQHQQPFQTFLDMSLINFGIKFVWWFGG